jgi:hypothetical protein
MGLLYPDGVTDMHRFVYRIASMDSMGLFSPVGIPSRLMSPLKKRPVSGAF